MAYIGCRLRFQGRVSYFFPANSRDIDFLPLKACVISVQFHEKTIFRKKIPLKMSKHFSKTGLLRCRKSDFNIFRGIVTFWELFGNVLNALTLSAEQSATSCMGLAFWVKCNSVSFCSTLQRVCQEIYKLT